MLSDSRIDKDREFPGEIMCSSSVLDTNLCQYACCSSSVDLIGKEKKMSPASIYFASFAADNNFNYLY